MRIVGCKSATQGTLFSVPFSSKFPELLGAPQPHLTIAGGDAIGALKRVAQRDDPPALVLRGIAMAQLGAHPLARELLRRAACGFGAHPGKVARLRAKSFEGGLDFRYFNSS